MKLRRLMFLATVLSVSSAAVLALPPHARATQGPPPYSDSRAVGYLTLYDAAGHLLTHGNIHDRPFAAAAVSSVAPLSEYAGPGRTATLAMYDPVNGQTPVQWNGDSATGSTFYADADHPTAYATHGDYSLSDWLTEYTPRWQGLVQLRLLLGAPGLSTLTTSYVASDIRIAGDTWSFVRAEGPHGGTSSLPPASAPRPADLSAALSAAALAESAGPSLQPTQGALAPRPPTPPVRTPARTLAAQSRATPPAASLVTARRRVSGAALLAGAVAILALGLVGGLLLGRGKHPPAL